MTRTTTIERNLLLLGGFSTVMTILAGFIGYQLWRTSIAETNERLRALTATSEALFNSGLKNAALAESIKKRSQFIIKYQKITPT